MQIFWSSVQLSCRLITRQWLWSASAGSQVYLIQRLINRLPLVIGHPYSFIVTARSKKIKLHHPVDMTDPKIEEALAPLRASVREQVSTIWALTRVYLIVYIVLKYLVIILRFKKKLMTPSIANTS